MWETLTEGLSWEKVDLMIQKDYMLDAVTISTELVFERED